MLFSDHGCIQRNVDIQVLYVSFLITKYIHYKQILIGTSSFEKMLSCKVFTIVSVLVSFQTSDAGEDGKIY